MTQKQESAVLYISKAVNYVCLTLLFAVMSYCLNLVFDLHERTVRIEANYTPMTTTLQIRAEIQEHFTTEIQNQIAAYDKANPR